MISPELTKQRISDGSAFYADQCREFAEAIGWPVQFTPSKSERNQPDNEPFDSVLLTCWSADVTDGVRTIGRLHIDLPDDPGNDRAFLTICELGNLQARQLSQIATTSRKLDHQKRNISLLLDVDASFESNDDLRLSLHDFLRAVAELSGFRAAAFFLLSSDGQALRLRVTHGMTTNEVPVPQRRLDLAPPDVRAFGDRQLTIHGNEESVYRRWLPDGFKTGYCLAVKTKSGPTGSLWLYDRRRREPDAGEQRMIRSVVSRLAGSLERVVLLHESAIHHRQNHDLQVASQCQQEVGPSLKVNHPAFESAAICSNRFELGGDLCDIIPLSDSRVIVAVGDASGDSVPAAMVMSAVRGAIRAVLCRPDLRKAPSPAEALQSVNQMLNDLSATYQFMSLFLGVIDFRKQTLSYCSAGHPYPFIVHNGNVAELSAQGILLGILPDMEYQVETTKFRSGDVLVAFSDGISEAMDADSKLFGSTGIASALEQAPLETAEGVLDAVLEKFQQHTAQDNGGDDRTLMVLRAK